MDGMLFEGIGCSGSLSFTQTLLQRPENLLGPRLLALVSMTRTLRNASHSVVWGVKRTTFGVLCVPLIIAD
jgi:hypothetical protein